MKFFKFFVCLTLLSAPVVNAQAAPTFDQMFSAEEIKTFGLYKLTPVEKKALADTIYQVVKEAHRLGRESAGQQTVQPAPQPKPVPAPALAGRSYSGSGYWIKENIERGSMIILNDGSVWQVDRMDKLDASLWMKLSNITIAESSDGMPGYNYLLINSDDKQAVHAKLIGKR